MAITANFNPRDAVRSKMDAFRARFEKALLLVLNELGAELAKTARDMHTYTDRTGNLTNSIWYAVMKGSRVVSMGGEREDGEGAEKAKEVILKIAGTATSKYTLAVVAGMEYASYVEARGYNVLIPAELQANKEFVPRMKELFAKADAKLKEMMK